MSDAMKIGALAKRSLLYKVPRAARASWAAANSAECPQCRARLGAAFTPDACIYPGHWSGARLDAAFAALCGTATEETRAETDEERAEREQDADAAAANDDGEDTADATADAADGLAGAFMETLRAVIAGQKTKPDLSQVQSMIDAAIAAAGPRVTTIEVKTPTAPAVDVGVAHRQFPLLVRLVGASCDTVPINVWLAGPAGSGKTTAARQAADALGLPFYFTGAIDTEYKLSGFVDANGRIVDTAFRRAYTLGGVFLFDEVDASLPAATLAFNAALANGHADFPGLDKPAVRHADFRCLAGGNTIHGATLEYVGRFKPDAAFLDRFSFLSWGYDESLERRLAGCVRGVQARHETPEDSGPHTADEWVDHVQRLRSKAADRGLRVVISPRASMRGAHLLRNGFTWAEAVDVEIRNRMTPADYDRLVA